VTAAEERIAALEAEVAELERRFSNMAVRVAALVVHHEMPGPAALSGLGPGQSRPAQLRLVPGSPGGRP
jgi:hypothetical protein